MTKKRIDKDYEFVKRILESLFAIFILCFLFYMLFRIAIDISMKILLTFGIAISFIAVFWFIMGLFKDWKDIPEK